MKKLMQWNWLAFISGVILIIYLGFVIFPLYWTLSTSLKTRYDIFAIPPKFITTNLTLVNYFDVFRLTPHFFTYLKNSIVVSIVTTLISIIIGSMAAYAFARYKFKQSSGLLYWILSMRMLPPLAVIVPFYIMIVKLQVFDRLETLIFVYLTFNLPIVVWLMTGYFQKVPVELEDAALIDGCSPLGALFRITLPLSLPGLVSTFILCLMFSWNEFAFAVMLTGQNARTLPVMMTSWSTDRGIMWGPMAASSMMIVIPMFLITSIVQRNIVKGLTFGAFK